MAIPTLQPFTVLTVVSPDDVAVLREMEPSICEARTLLRPLGWHVSWHVIVNGSGAPPADLCGLRCESFRLPKPVALPVAREFGMSNILGGWMMILDDGILLPEGLAEVMASMEDEKAWAAATGIDSMGSRQDSWVAKHSAVSRVKWMSDNDEWRVRTLLAIEERGLANPLSTASVAIKTCASHAKPLPAFASQESPASV